MRFQMPHLPLEFQIPDEWWAEAGMTAGLPEGRAFRSDATAQLVPLVDIEPSTRCPETVRDFRGFERDRLIEILRGIASAASIPPICLLTLREGDRVSHPYHYAILNGHHRFYASIAAGFDLIPAFCRDPEP